MRAELQWQMLALSFHIPKVIWNLIAATVAPETEIKIAETGGKRLLGRDQGEPG